MPPTSDDIRSYLENRLCWVETQGPLDTPCWIWTGSLNRPNGYGLPNIKKTQFTSNRAAWLAWRGEIPAGLKVLHHCDTPPCVNPEHLYVGTMKRNIEDMWGKDRSNRRKYGIEDVRLVRELRGQGLTLKQVSAQTGMSADNIAVISRGERWIEGSPAIRNGRGNSKGSGGMRQGRAGAERVRELRGQGLTYQEIASIVGMHPNHVGDICRGQHWNGSRPGWGDGPKARESRV